MEKRHHHKKLGLALVGLGHYATDRVAVGLEASEYWHLAAIVTGSREKVPAWQEKWKIPDDRVFSYKNFDHIEDCPDIDAVYICLPNNMHADLTGQEPVSVTAQFGPCTDAEKFREVEEHISWQMRFANDIYVTGYAGYSGYLDELCIRTSEHLIKLEPAFSYGPLAGSVRNGEEHAIRHTHEHQQWKQMEELGKLFLDPAPLPDFISGSEGLRDLKIISAIYDAANSGQEVIF